MSLLTGQSYCCDHFPLLPKFVAILNCSRMASDYVAAREQGQFSVHETHKMLSFCRRFYPKQLTIGGYMNRFILKRQTDRGSARNTKSQALLNKYKLAREEDKDKEKDVFVSYFCLHVFCRWWLYRMMFTSTPSP